jgi:hypothetical protein
VTGLGKSLGVSAPSIQDQSEASMVEQFFLSKLAAFMAIFAPNGLTRTHILSFGLLVHGGPSLLIRSDDLIDALRLFRDRDVEPTDGFRRTVVPLLRKLSENYQSQRQSIPLTAPDSYRPIGEQSYGSAVDPASCPPHTHADEPLFVSNEECPSGYGIFEPSQYCDVGVEMLKDRTVYICGAVSAIFITHCKDSFIFVGAANAVHIEYCANCRIICAARMVHVDASIRSTLYLLTNTRPIVTGACPKLVLAPYNALYRRLGLDLLAIGISPVVNLWNQPVMIGSLALQTPERMAPDAWDMICVPFTWTDMEPMINIEIPPEYAKALEAKRQQVMKLKEALEVIRQSDPELGEQIIQQLKARANASFAEPAFVTRNGKVTECEWLNELERQQELMLRAQQGGK